MSVHFAELSSHWMMITPLAVLVASLLGSAHCVGMCGGLVVAVARSKGDVLRYHLGRLLGYCSLGAIAGYLGETVFRSKAFTVIPWLSSTIIALGFVFLGVQVWQGRSPHLFRLPGSLWRKLSNAGPGATGLLSAFLPCGWLHAFVLGAVATQSASLGAIYLFFFWLGTLPALSLAPIAFDKLFRPAMLRAPRISAVILVALGIASLGIKLVPAIAAGGSASSCHCHHKAPAVK